MENFFEFKITYTQFLIMFKIYGYRRANKNFIYLHFNVLKAVGPCEIEMCVLKMG